MRTITKKEVARSMIQIMWQQRRPLDCFKSLLVYLNIRKQY